MTLDVASRLTFRTQPRYAVTATAAWTYTSTEAVTAEEDGYARLAEQIDFAARRKSSRRRKPLWADE